MTSTTSSPTNVTLVIIDDNAGSLEMLAAALAREGLSIFTANDPKKVWRLFSGSIPRLF